METATGTPTGATVTTLEGRTAKGASFGQGAQGGASGERRRGSDPRSATTDDQRSGAVFRWRTSPTCGRSACWVRRSRQTRPRSCGARCFRLGGSWVWTACRRFTWFAGKPLTLSRLPPTCFPWTGCDPTSRASSSPPMPFPVGRRRGFTSAGFSDAFVEGLGERAQESLSHYLDRAAARLIRLIEREQQENAPPPSYEHELDMVATRSRAPWPPQDLGGSSRPVPSRCGLHRLDEVAVSGGLV